MKQQVAAIKRMLAFILAGASLVTALNIAGAIQSEPSRATSHVATSAQGRG